SSGCPRSLEQSEQREVPSVWTRLSDHVSHSSQYPPSETRVRGLSSPARLFSVARSIMAGVTCRISFMVTIPTSFPPSITASRRILRWFMNLAASFTVAPGLMLATGFDIVCATFSSDGRTFLADTLCTIYIFVIIPAGFADLSTMITQQMTCFLLRLNV